MLINYPRSFIHNKSAMVTNFTAKLMTISTKVNNPVKDTTNGDDTDTLETVRAYVEYLGRHVISCYHDFHEKIKFPVDIRCTLTYSGNMRFWQ